MNSSYSHPEFTNLLKEPENQKCFDCGKTPVQWASVNNGVFLCIECSGNHRGYGVNISFIRSMTLDSWNDNQINLMKIGGNKNLRELLEVYNIDKNKIDKNILYNSKIMDFYRKYLKNKANNLPNEEQAPSKEDALKSINFNIKINDNENDINKFKSIGSDVKEKDEKSFQVLLGKWMNSAVEGTKGVVKKVNDLNIPGKIVNTGKNILDKGTQLSKSEKVQNFAKKANDTLNYYINWLTGKKKEEKKEDDNKKDNQDKNDLENKNDKEIYEGETKENDNNKNEGEKNDFEEKQKI
jgi:hypothetical protein